MIREFLRRFRAAWPKGAILWDTTALIVLALSIALQVAAQLLRGPIKREGPRLDDLAPTGVQPGAIIPATHGHTTTPGTVIAQTRLKETKKKQKQGGKGSPSVETTTFSYSIPAVAVAFSRRPIADIVRIKANEKVIYEQTATEGLVYRNFAEIEIFQGSETQAPSGILEAHEGVGNVPAYRGTAYFVLKDLQLADFGNRMPVFRVECAEDSVFGDFTKTVGTSVTSRDTSDQYVVVDWDLGKAYISDFDDVGSDHGIQVWDLATLSYEKTIIHGLNAFPQNPKGVDPETGYIVGNAASSGQVEDWVLDPATEMLVTHLTRDEGHPTDPSMLLGPWSLCVFRLSASDAAVISRGSDDTRYRAHSFPALILIDHWDGPDPNPSGATFKSYQPTPGATGEAWGGYLLDSEFRVVKFTLQAGGNVTLTVAGTINASDISESGAVFTPSFEVGKQLYFDPDDGGLVIPLDMGSPTEIWLVKWSETGGLLWKTQLSDGFTFDNRVSDQNYQVNGPELVIPLSESGSTGPVLYIDLRDGSTELVELGDAYALDRFWWDGVTKCGYNFEGMTAEPETDLALRKYCFSFAIGGTSIGRILRSALTEWAPDVSPLIEGDHFEIDAALFADPFLVTGATFTQLAAPREIAEMCVIWKPVVFFEGGDRIKFRPRDGTRQATVRHLDLGQRPLSEEVRPTVTTTRQDDVQLPREVRVKFLDENRFFSANVAYARITRSRSALVQEFEMPFAGVPADAKFASWTAMGEAFAARRSHEGSLPLPYFILEPGDIIDLPNNDGDLIEVRADRLELGANLVIALRASDHVNSYDNIAFAAETGVLEKIPLIRPQLPIMYALDLPRLTDDPVVDDGLKLLVGLGGTYPEWKGGAIYRDTASGGSGATAFGESVGTATQEFEEIATTSLSVDGGKLTTPPSGDVDEFTVDRLSVMRVTFDTAEPAFASLSDTAFLVGFDNVLAIGDNVKGWEIVQAQEVAQIDAQTWDFSVLRRGIRGTEHMIGNTAAGDTVVALSSATLQRDGFSAGSIGETITYRGVTTNMDVASAPDTDVIVVGRGLIPFAPLLGQAYRDADGTITGTLYARPLQADDADQFFLVDPDFAIDIKDGPGGTVLRTISLVDTGAFTYTDAQQVTDFGSVQAVVDAELFQLDDDGNRGYGREVTL